MGNREREMNLLKELSDNARTLQLMKQEEASRLSLQEAKRRALIEAKLENDKIKERKSENKRKQNEADFKIIQESIARSLSEELRRSQELHNRFKSSYDSVKIYECQSEGELDDS